MGDLVLGPDEQKAVAAVFAIVVGGLRLWLKDVRDQRDECCRKADAHERANAERLAAFERRDAEERAWRWQQERDAARGGAGG